MSSDGLLVELHAGVTYRDFGFPLDPERLWERFEPVPLLGREVLTFSAEDLLLILCATARNTAGSRSDGSAISPNFLGDEAKK